MAKRKHTPAAAAARPDPGPTTVAELSEILREFSVAISAIKVARQGLDSPSLDHAIIDQALELAIDSVDDAYDRLDAAIVRIARPESKEAPHG
jgi:hypothetical protein